MKAHDPADRTREEDTVDRIPIYDESTSITCTIGDDEVDERVALFERMRRNLRTVSRTDHGLLLHFPRRADVEAGVRRFAIDEKRCCRFWGFAVETGQGELTLRWDAPPAASEVLARIEASLLGEAPITSIRSLL